MLDRFLLTQAVDGREDAALGAACRRSGRVGTLLYVPKGVKVEAPLFSLVGLSSEGRVDMNHTLVILEEGAEATLIQEATGEDDRTRRRCTRGRSS